MIPSAPHISISCYSADLSEQDVFLRVCQIAGKLAGARAATVDVASDQANFAAISDLAGGLKAVATSFEDFGNEVEPGFRPVRAYMASGRVGPSLVKYELAEPPDNHPIAVIFAAGAAGIPAELRSRSQRLEAKRIGGFARRLCRIICDEVEPLYAQLAIEETLPAPARLKARGTPVGGELYLSTNLIGPRSEFVEAMRARYGVHAAVEWSSGIFFSGSAPLAEHGIPDDEARELSMSVSRILAESLS